MNATCSNTVGSFTCACDDGTTANADSNPNSLNPAGDGSTCYPVDECLYSLHNCHGQAACSDTLGSFRCNCNSGYEGTGVACTDINECVPGPAMCDALAACDNTPGSFTCTCSAGYLGSGLDCVDLNECVYKSNTTCHVRSHRCFTARVHEMQACFCSLPPAAQSDMRVSAVQEAATCTNSIGSYSCTCPDGWRDEGPNAGEVCVNPRACDPPQEATCDVRPCPNPFGRQRRGLSLRMRWNCLSAGDLGRSAGQRTVREAEHDRHDL